MISLTEALRGRYLVDRELGRGGMGIVYLARDVALDRAVAIKLLPPEFARLPEVRVRFLQEARMAARLSHPHIVPIYTVEEHGDLVCYVMAYIAGQTLAEKVRDGGPLAAAAVGRLVQEVAWALAYAHQHGVIHRDVKPENILLERGSGRALVTDFGIARLTDALPVTPAERVMGTPRLVSPEQAAGEPLDGRSDLYSLGVTAFFALTGRYPFEGDSAGQLLAQHLTVPAPPVAAIRADVPRALAVAIDRCLAKAPDARFANGEELALAVGEERSRPIPRVLQLVVREISELGVDVVSFGTLALVAVLTQILTRDFMGFGHVYTVGLGAVLASIAAIRGIHLGRLFREAAGEGWGQEDLLQATDREARENEANERRRPPLGRQLLFYAVGLGAVLLYWLGPKQWGLESADTLPGLVIELLGLAAPVALGRWLGTQLEAPREGRPGLLSRFFIRFKSGMFFRLLGRGKQRSVHPAIVDQPTEMVLLEQAQALFSALPASERKRLREAEDLLRKLAEEASVHRARITDLDRALADVGGTGTAARRQAGEEITAARQSTAVRLATTLSALETLRLELLRARVGLGSGNLTEQLDRLERVTRGIDAAVESGEV
jgi:eukaryotic-like serine/threonine-protein kinase